MLAVTLLISILLGLLPLGGIAWFIKSGSMFTVDGLFTSLILLAMSAVFFFNASLELRDRGLLPFLRQDKAASGKQPPVSKAE